VLSGTPDSSGSGTQATNSAAKPIAGAGDRTQAAAALCTSVFEAVRGLVQCPADLEKLLGMLVALGSELAADCTHAFGGFGPGRCRESMGPFSDAMRHLRQQHTLETGALVAVHHVLWKLVQDAMVLRAYGLHSLHLWACGCSSRVPMPLPLLQLLGVSVDLPTSWDNNASTGPLSKLQAAVGNSAPALALALVQTEPWTKEVLEQRLEFVKDLVVAGASYSWEGPGGATVLSLATQLQDGAFLHALLAGPNALQGVTSQQMSAAVVAAAKVKYLGNGCMLLEAVARSQGQPEAKAEVRAEETAEQQLSAPGLQDSAGPGPAFAQAAASAQHDRSTAATVSVPGTALSAAPGLVDAPAAAAATLPDVIPPAATTSGLSVTAAPALVLTPAAVAAAAKLLVSAVKRRKVHLVRRLLAAGVDPDVLPDSKADPALHEVVLQADAKGGNLVSGAAGSWPFMCPCALLHYDNVGQGNVSYHTSHM
jgi:hypothetical protein